MQQQLKFLQQVLEEINNDPQKSLKYFTTDNKWRNNETTPPSDCKWELIGSVLHHIEHSLEQINDCSIIDPAVSHNLDKLNILYQSHQQYCWVSHQHHFHTNFQEYINCPMTCIAEITEYLDKLTKEIYKA